VLALVLATLCLAAVSLADGDEGDGVLQQPAEPQAPPPQNGSAAPSQDLDELRARLGAQNLELGEASARLAVSKAELRDQTLRGDILSCIVVALLGAILVLGWHLRRQVEGSASPDTAEKAKGPRRPSFE